jgi:hypothetical protein
MVKFKSGTVHCFGLGGYGDGCDVEWVGRSFDRPVVPCLSLYTISPHPHRDCLAYLSETTALIGKHFHPSSGPQPAAIVRPVRVRPAATRTEGAARANKSSRIRRGQRTVQLTNTPACRHERGTGVAGLICGLGSDGGPASHELWARCVGSASRLQE